MLVVSLLAGSEKRDRKAEAEENAEEDAEEWAENAEQLSKGPAEKRVRAIIANSKLFSR